MSSRADGIRSQLDASIYDDDPDAIEQLEERLTELEAKREQIKAHNKEHRAGKLCPCPPECDCRTYYPRDCACTKHPLPSYVLSNLSGNIKRNRDRLARLQRQATAPPTPGRLLSLRYAGTCGTCSASLEAGATAYYRRSDHTVTCQGCAAGAAWPTPHPQRARSRFPLDCGPFRV